MKKFTLIIFVIIGFHSCMSYQSMFQVIPEETAEEIPLKADKIIISNNQSLNENYNQAFKTLLSQDYRIENDNKEMGYISASKKDIGDTHVRLNIVCEENEIQVSSEWKPGSQSANMASAMTGINISIDWDNAQWNKKSDKPSVAFANAVMFSKELSNDLKYVAPETTPKEKVNRKEDPIYR